jgi:CRP-like cAMP-binding protein
VGSSREVQKVPHISRRPDPCPEALFAGARATYPKGTVLLRQGDRVTWLYLIERGVIKMTRAQANGRELIVAFRSTGWLLGASAAILGEPAELAAECVCESDARPVPVGDFLRLQGRDPAVATWLQRMLAREVREQSARMGQFLLRPSTRLEHLLATLAPLPLRGGGSEACRVPFPIRQHEVADALGVRRETATRLLAEAERRGTIERKGGWIFRKA